MLTKGWALTERRKARLTHWRKRRVQLWTETQKKRKIKKKMKQPTTKEKRTHERERERRKKPNCRLSSADCCRMPKAKMEIYEPSGSVDDDHSTVPISFSFSEKKNLFSVAFWCASQNRFGRHWLSSSDDRRKRHSTSLVSTMTKHNCIRKSLNLSLYTVACESLVCVWLCARIWTCENDKLKGDGLRVGTGKRINVDCDETDIIIVQTIFMWHSSTNQSTDRKTLTLFFFVNRLLSVVCLSSLARLNVHSFEFARRLSIISFSVSLACSFGPFISYVFRLPIIELTDERNCRINNGKLLKHFSLVKIIFVFTILYKYISMFFFSLLFAHFR